MDINKIEIELNREEEVLLNEISDLQSKINEFDPDKLNGQLMDAIKDKSIETITMALGVSDILENTGYSNGLKFKQEYNDFKNWENTPIEDRTKSYIPKHVPKSEFKKLIDKPKVKYDRESYVKKGPGLSQKDTQKKKYKESLKKGGINDAYTGKFINNGETDKKNKAYQWEHIKSAKEVHSDPVLSLLNLEEKRNFLNSDENLVPVLGKLNNQKRAVELSNLPKWLNSPSKENPNKTNKEFFEIDENRINEAISKSNKKEESILKDKTITYGFRAQSKIAVTNAAKSGAKAAIGKLLSITVVEVINEFKKSEEVDFKTKVTNISKRIKEKTKEILSSFKDHSLNSFLSTFIDALLNSVFKIAKNIFKFVKTAFMSLLKAIKILISSEYTWEERLKEVLKIMGVTVAALVGLALDEVIEKALIANLPFTTPFAGYISPVLSGLIVGISSVLLLQGFQKYKSQMVYKNLKTQEASKTNKLSKTNLVQAGISDFRATESVVSSITLFSGALPIINSCKKQINQSINELNNIQQKIDKQNIEIDKIQDSNEELLNQLRLL